VQPTHKQVLVVVTGLGDCASSWCTATGWLVILCAASYLKCLFFGVRLFFNRPELGFFGYSLQLVSYIYLNVRPVVVRMERWLVLCLKRILRVLSYVL
jgi:hypothetical protein